MSARITSEEDVKLASPDMDLPIPKTSFSASQKFFAELLGTQFLVFIGSAIGCITHDLVAASFGGSFIVCGMIYIFGPISGAQFNPAVSVPMFLRGFLTGFELFYYTIAQTIGAFMGSGLVGVLRKGNFEELGTTHIQPTLIQMGGKNEIDAWCYLSALFCETVMTFILVMIVFGSTVKRNRFENLTGIIIGFTLTFLTMAAFRITGGSFNPVRSLAPAVLQFFFGGNKEPLYQIWIYFVGPLSGGIIASFISIFFL